MANELKYLNSKYDNGKGTRFYIKVDDNLKNYLKDTPFLYLTEYYDYIDIYEILSRYYTAKGENITPNYLYDGKKNGSTSSDKGFYCIGTNAAFGLHGSKKLSDNDNWVKTIESPYILDPDNKNFIIAGTFPKFKTKHYIASNPGKYIIERVSNIKRTDSNGNIIAPIDNSYIRVITPSGVTTFLNNSSFSSTNDSDKEVPTSIIIGLHGAGGGGSYRNGLSVSGYPVYYGNGGGAGGSVYIALTFTSLYSKFQITVGSYGTPGTSSNGNGGDGGDTYLEYVTASGSKNINVAYAVAEGGKGGEFTYNADEAAGGGSGNLSGSAIAVLTTITGGKGGVSVHPLTETTKSSKGEDISGYIYATRDRLSQYVGSDKYCLRKTFSNEGGSSYGNGYISSAGGGASVLSGGKYYKYNSSTGNLDVYSGSVNITAGGSSYGCGGCGSGKDSSSGACAGSNGAFEIYY